MSHRATYNDGQTATRHDVLCIDASSSLVIQSGETTLATWRYDDIRAADSVSGLRFRTVGSDARLTLPENDHGQWLIHKFPNLKKGDNPTTRWPVWLGAGVFAVISLAGIFIYLIPQMSSAVVQMIPHSYEQKMGQQSRDQIVGVLERANSDSGHLICDAEAGMRVLQKRADEIANLMESPFPINITVIDVGVPNAFALPGGQVVLLSGMIDDAKSGDEVIGVLAHEIAHVVRRDPLQVSIKQTGTAFLISLLVGDVFGGTVLSGVGSTVIESGYSREAESASDIMAVTALNQLGLTARPLADFLSRLSEADPISAAIPEFLSTHPSGENRADEIRRLSQSNGRALSKFEWQAVQSICD
jgi:Zn-dependent protease with chaperone function